MNDIEQAVSDLLNYVITVRKYNTTEWMNELVRRVNLVAELRGDTDRVKLERGGLVVVKEVW